MNKKQRAFVYIGVFLVSVSISFVLGRLSKNQPQTGVVTKKNQSALIIQADPKIIQDSEELQEGDQDTIILRGSSRGSKYYYPWCPSTFSEANTIYFDSVKEAESQGYTLASNCISSQN